MPKGEIKKTGRVFSSTYNSNFELSIAINNPVLKPGIYLSSKSLHCLSSHSSINSSNNYLCFFVSCSSSFS